MTKVLAIDDNEDITFAVKMALEQSKKYNVERAHSGKEGLGKMESAHPDVVLLDIMMPDMNGWIVNKEIKKNEKWRDIPVVFVTAKTDKVSRDMGEHGGAGFITKPFDNSALKKTIDAIVKKKK